MEGGTGSGSADPAMPNYYPDRLEAGTPNAPSIAGLNAGMRFVLDDLRPSNETTAPPPYHKLLTQLHTALSAIWGVTPYAAKGLYCQSGVMSFTVEGQNAESVAARLSSQDIAVRAGLHCAPHAHRTAGTFPDGTVRVSLGAFNTSADIRKLAAAVRRL